MILSSLSSSLPSGDNALTFKRTFELASSYEDMKTDGETKGLTDTYENMKKPDAIGGTLGVTAGDESEELLPI